MPNEIDLFDMEPAKPKGLITGGRYRIPINPDGTEHKGGWQRVSNLASCFSDQRALSIWEQRQILLGLMSDEALYEELCTLRIDTLSEELVRGLLEGIASKAKLAAKSDMGARRGTLRHNIVEDHHAGLPPVVGGAMKRQLDSYVAEMQRQRLTAVTGMQERVIVNQELGVAGRFDNVLSCDVTCRLYIGDLKSQARFWSWLEIIIQQAIYANADAIWDEKSGVYLPMPKVDRKVAIIMHMPAKTGDDVQFYEIDIEMGWRFAQLAARIRDARSVSKSTKTPLGRLRIPPAEAIQGKSLKVEVKSLFDWMDEARTPDDVRRIKAANVHRWTPELQEYAVHTMARLKNLARRG